MKAGSPASGIHVTPRRIVRLMRGEAIHPVNHRGSLEMRREDRECHGYLPGPIATFPAWRPPPLAVLHCLRLGLARVELPTAVRAPSFAALWEGFSTHRRAARWGLVSLPGALLRGSRMALGITSPQVARSTRIALGGHSKETGSRLSGGLDRRLP